MADYITKKKKEYITKKKKEYITKKDDALGGTPDKPGRHPPAKKQWITKKAKGGRVGLAHGGRPSGGWTN